LSTIGWFWEACKSSVSWKLIDYIKVIYITALFRSIEGSFDVIHTHGFQSKVPLIRLRTDIDTPIVLTVHSYSRIRFSGEDSSVVNMLREEANNVDHVIHVSKSSEKSGGKFGIRWKCDKSVVYNPINFNFTPDFRHCLSRAIFIGSLSSRKGLGRLLDLWERNADSFDLAVVGMGEMSDYVKKVSGRCESVKYLGYLEKERVVEEVSKSRVLVVPSRSESFGLVYLESLAVGTPVVGYHKTINEFTKVMSMSDEEKEFLIPYNFNSDSTHDLSDKISRARRVIDKENYVDVARSIRGKILSRFGIDRAVDEVLSIYNRVTCL
jgi:glycosyltransferase involved in cell wall biosynthesis